MMESDRENKTILVVDDDRPVREAMQEIIEAMGYEVLTADRASEGIQVIERASVDVLLLDIHMPGAHGHHMLRFLKERNKPIPPTIVVSGSLKGDLLPELIQLGVNGIVAKPFTAHRLRTEIDRLLGKVSEEAQFCTQCGQPLQPGDQFCRSCGENVALRKACSGCGEAYEPEDRFCGKCGMKFE